MKVKNITNGPKGVNSAEGPVEIGPGQEVDVEMSEAEVASSKRMKWFEFSGSASASDDDQPKTAAEVLEMAKDPNVQFMTFKAAATKLLSGNTPSKKDEIIAALEDLATKP
ncbi:hypothetical protein [Rhizobium ruizarguesonis]|uniref:hypothetical protein n=1 Tax=Rhizobium ruizarguesonis TaxID=2081791 RepID=UPI001031C7F8|nr:hypothetical protein [Rhizobium ruizarguesonis]TBF08715.1 hypothetical protein ELG96_08355 [Rhizobium ruizarguesonis]